MSFCTFQVKRICGCLLLNVAFVEVQADSCPVVCRSACGRAGLTRFCDVPLCEGSWSGRGVFTVPPWMWCCYNFTVKKKKKKKKNRFVLFFSELNSNISQRNLLKMTFLQQNTSLSGSCLFIRGHTTFYTHTNTISSSFFFISTIIFQPRATYILCMWLLRMSICHRNPVWEKKC